METRLDQEIFSEENKEFYEEYFELLIAKVTNANMELEHDLGNPANSKNAIRFKDNMKAFKYLIQTAFNPNSLSEEIIIEVANTVNQSAWYVSNGYRKIGADTIDGSEVPISKHENVPHDMQVLLENYHTLWSNLDPYEREALFHIGFIRIHPFEDGNGRTGRLILNYNLLRQGLAPVILTTELEEYYHEFIKEFDEMSMARLFKNQSLQEKEIVDKLFQEYKENKRTL